MEMREQPSVSVAIPLYTEEAVVAELLTRTRAVLDEILSEVGEPAGTDYE
ncbi:MAG: hypothetical protein WA653_12775 [Candidatus Sulfotelmatobacter sp.]